jgi:hypothetical protein
MIDVFKQHADIITHTINDTISMFELQIFNFISMHTERLRHGRHGPRRPRERGGSTLLIIQ